MGQGCSTNRILPRRIVLSADKLGMLFAELDFAVRVRVHVIEMYYFMKWMTWRGVSGGGVIGFILYM